MSEHVDNSQNYPSQDEGFTYPLTQISKSASSMRSNTASNADNKDTSNDSDQDYVSSSKDEASANDEGAKTDVGFITETGRPSHGKFLKTIDVLKPFQTV